ncbi:MAG TPA: C13 family peptidase, partial [Candidatus Kryptonia bacterium]|nr:C13 family peptidase [Candidatus Kryptonia bacterium]
MKARRRPESRRLAWVCAGIALLLAAGCTSRSLRPTASSSPRLHAVLINGGGDVANNYQSHLSHIRSLLAILQPIVRPADIAIFSSDGADPAADLATREPAVEPEFWLLPQASIGQALRPQTVYVNSVVDGFALRPARKEALRQWFEREGRALRAGDTLLIYVTDHGERNKDDWSNNTITLWGESLSVSELREMLARLDSEVRVVMLMSQCFSGAFAQAIFPALPDQFPPGNVCGYFAVTADRPAYGCYPENRGREGIGHSHDFFEALQSLGRFPEAERRVLVTDRTPDVPFSTVDFWLEQRVHRAAQAAGRDPAAYVDELLAEAWQDRGAWEPDIRLLDRIAHTFGMFSPRSLAELNEQARVLPELSKQLDLYANRWREALEALQIDTLVRFVDTNPAWRERLEPKQLERLDADGRRATSSSLLEGLSAFARADEQRFSRIESLREKADDTAATAYRNEVRLGAVLRLEMRLISIAGRQYVSHHGSDAERAALQR